MSDTPDTAPDTTPDSTQDSAPQAHRARIRPFQAQLLRLSHSEEQHAAAMRDALEQMASCPAGRARLGVLIRTLTTDDADAALTVLSSRPELFELVRVMAQASLSRGLAAMDPARFAEAVEQNKRDLARVEG